MLRVCRHSVSECWSYTFTENYLLSIRMSTSEHIEHTLTLFRLKKGLKWSKNNSPFSPSSPKKVCMRMLSIRMHTFFTQTLWVCGVKKICWLKNIHFEPPHNISSNGKNNSFSKISCLGTFKCAMLNFFHAVQHHNGTKNLRYSQKLLNKHKLYGHCPQNRRKTCMQG